MSRTRERRRRDRTQPAAPTSVAPPGLPGGSYKPLSQADVRRIHEASLTVLERTGIEVMPSECREIFRAAGARVIDAENRVYIPRSMVEDALAWPPTRCCWRAVIPSMICCWAARGCTWARAGRRSRCWIWIAAMRGNRPCPMWPRSDGWWTRWTTSISISRACVARDIPSDLLDINTFYASLTNTTKHVTGNCFSVQSVREVAEMGAMIVGGEAKLRERPILSITNCWTVSPLRYATETVEVLTEIIRQGIPVFLSSAPQSGATSPAALAGTLVQINAEELSGVVYTQLVQPGAAMVLGYVPSVSDLRTGNYVGGSPEFAMMHAAAAQLGQFYNLPVYNSSGLTDSKMPDVQAGYEKGMTSLAAALAGSNYIHHSAGLLESMMTVAYEQYVIDDDINGAVMRMVRGIEVTDETLSLDVIDEVCRGRGTLSGHGAKPGADAHRVLLSAHRRPPAPGGLGGGGQPDHVGGGEEAGAGDFGFASA